jgi:hypothetical protein
MGQSELLPDCVLFPVQRMGEVEVQTGQIYEESTGSNVQKNCWKALDPRSEVHMDDGIVLFLAPPTSPIFHMYVVFLNERP